MLCRWIWLTCLLVVTVGCTNLPNKDNAGSSGTSGSGCIDRDQDGFGDNCSAGRDCNDFDPAITNQCQGACAHPSEGCECTGEAPLPCFLPQTANSDGTIMCREGTRSCRDGMWSACEGIHEYTVQPRQDTRLLADVFPRRTCSDCEQNCFVAEDHLEYVDGGIPSTYVNAEIEQIPAGGVTVRRINDASVMMVDAGADMWPDGAVSQWPIDAGPCLIGMNPLDTDCDNIPNYYDRSPNNPDDPFDSPHETIVSTTPSDQSILVEIADFELELRQADVYFALDTTAGQLPERQAFIDAINNVGVTPTLLQRVAGTNTAVCYDADRDGIPDDFPAAGTLIDAIRCFTGDARIGLGFFNEVPIADSCSVPFTASYAPTSGTWTQCDYGSTSDIVFRNLFDVSDNYAALQAAAWRLPAITPRLEIAQAGTQALWALAAGNTGDLYYGPGRPAFGARADCPAGTYGAACFRSGVMPITFMFTGGGQHNGPTNYIPTGYRPPITINTNPRASGAPYLANNMAIPSASNWGTPHDGGAWRAQHLAQTGETPYAPLLLSSTPLDNRRLTFTGSTIGMTSDVTPAHMGCGAVGAPDTFLAFDLANPTNVTFTLTQTPYDSNGAPGAPPGTYPKVLSVFSSVVPPTPYNLTMMSTPVGGIEGTSRQYIADTNAAGFGPGSLGNLSQCGADGQTNEASITFTVPAGGVQLLGDMSLSGGDAVVDIYSNAPLANPVVTNLPNINDTFATAHVIPTVSGGPGYVSFRGNTAAATLPNNVPATAVTCGAHTAARDAVFRFHVDTPRQVVIDTEGLPGDIDTVISLHYAPPIESVAYTMDATGETTTVDNTGAITATGFDIGGAENAISTITGTTAGAAADFAGGELYSCGGAWAAHRDAPDQVIHFGLSSPTSVRIRDTDNAGYNPLVAIFGGASPTLNKPPVPRTLITTAAGTGEDAANAWDLGNPVGKQIVAEGVTFTTSGKTPHYNAGQFRTSCNNSSQSPDVVYAFTPTAPMVARIRVDGVGGTPLTNSMVALFDEPPSNRSTALPGNDAASATAVMLNNTVPIGFANTTGAALNQATTAPFACNINAGARDVFYRFDVPPGPAQEVQFRVDRDDSPSPAFDPVLRMYRSPPILSSTTNACPNGTPPGATANGCDDQNDADTAASLINATNARVIRTANFGATYCSGSVFLGVCLGTTLPYHPDNTDNNGFCGACENSRDAVFKFRTTTTSTLRLEATAGNPITFAVFPATATQPFAASAGTCAMTGSGTTSVSHQAAFAPGDYYVVVKSRYTHDPLLGSPGCGSGDNMQDSTVTFSVTDMSGLAFACSDEPGNNYASEGWSEPGSALPAPNANSALLYRVGADALTTGSYYLSVTSQTAGTGNYYLSATRVGHEDLGCGTASGGTATITTPMLSAGTTYYLVVKGQTAGAAGTHRVTIQDTTNTDPDPNYCLGPNVATPAGNLVLPAGDYWALIKGTSAASSGGYVLEVADQTALSGSNRVTPLVVGEGVGCDNNSGPSNRSKIVANLTPTTAPQNLSGGDYWIVVKGATAADSGPYQLNVRDVSTMNSNLVTCAGGTGASAFDVNLAPGTYTATFKGVDGINGPIAAFLYDDTAAPTGTCVASGTPVALNAGRNIIAIKGSNGTAPYNAGAYQLTVSAGTPPSAGTAERAFASKSWATSRGAVAAAGMKVVPMQSCEPGTDWGTGAGDGNASGTTFSACGHTYSGPAAGALALVGLILSIIPFIGCILFNVVALPFVLLGLVQVDSPLPSVISNPVSCNTANPDALYASVQTPAGTNPPRGAWPQSKEIARTTGTVDTAGNPIAAWLRENPTSDTVALEITRALYRLAQNLRMDVSMDMVWDSTTTPVYVVQITAVSPSPCSGGALGATHRGCAIGNHPQFRVQFTNPTTMPVAQNPDPGWSGGWPGRLRIMGDGQFVLDEIPVFLIPPLPNPMPPPPPPPRYSGQPGVYHQDIGTRECMGTNLPDWTDLYFRAEMAPGTRIEFEACAADDPADLDSCTMQTVATVTATNVSCFSDTDPVCRAMNGYCGPSTPDRLGAFCRTLSPQKAAGLCSVEAECPDGTPSSIDGMPLLSDCVMGECTFDSPPADIGAALGADNYRRFSRMRITLRPDSTNAYAPNLLEWSAVYVCTPAQ